MRSQLLVQQGLESELGASEIHIWHVSLDRPAHPYIGLLSADERERAGLFRFERERRRFAVCRGILRILLGRYLDFDPGGIKFEYGRNAKPALAHRTTGPKVCFSVSHSQEAALYAFAIDREVGIDIEWIRDVPEMGQIVEQFFSIGENTRFRSLPESEKEETFFRLWTRKEAFAKATGDGLRSPVDWFDVPLPLNVNSGPVRGQSNSGEASQWSVQDLNVPVGFAAALAVRGSCYRVRSWRWSDHLEMAGVR